jgi:hypothetical protein
MLSNLSRRIERLARRLFGAPFENLPRGFGKSMPEIRTFKQEMDETQHRAHGNAPTRSVRRHERAKPTR